MNYQTTGCSNRTKYRFYKIYTRRNWSPWHRLWNGYRLWTPGIEPRTIGLGFKLFSNSFLRDNLCFWGIKERKYNGNGKLFFSLCQSNIYLWLLYICTSQDVAFGDTKKKLKTIICEPHHQSFHWTPGLLWTSLKNTFKESLNQSLENAKTPYFPPILPTPTMFEKISQFTKQKILKTTSKHVSCLGWNLDCNKTLYCTKILILIHFILCYPEAWPIIGLGRGPE